MKIRSYQSSDKDRCRHLWKVLTAHHRDIYQNQSIGGDNPEDLFDEHLQKVGPDNIWVATKDNEVVGMIGLEQINSEYYVEPIVVDPDHQGQGTGKKLMQFIIAKAKKLDLKSLSVKSVGRNVSAIKFYHQFGFDKIGFVELFMTLDKDSNTEWKSDLELFGLKFKY